MNKSVNFEIAKLLKEKGFDIPIQHTIADKNYVYDVYTQDFVKNITTNIISNWNDEKYQEILSAPTIVEVVMWLYEKYGIWIYVKQGYNWEWFIETISNKPELIYNDGLENSLIEAYESAIKYTLENLIQGGNK